MKHAPGFVFVLGAVLLSSPAGAYVRYHSKAGAPLRWCRPAVDMTVYNGTPLQRLTTQDMAGAAGAALAAWSAAGVNDCTTAMQLTLHESSAARPRAAFDHHNAIVFRTDSWSYEGPPPSDDGDPSLDYDASALALTTIFSLRDGLIVDADIEVNALSWTWIWSESPPSKTQDLQNTLTHEVGHVVGLEHTCWSGQDTQPLDHLGNLVPSCPLPSEVARTTMYPSASSQDVSKRALSVDEQRAMCDIYPPGAPDACSDDGCGCQVPSPSPDRWPALMLSILLLVHLRRRRGRART